MMRTRRSWIVVALILVPTLYARGGGIGILGDSYSDEYQFYAPHRAAARNWVEILAATRGLDFGAFSATSRGEPRNGGFAYNWARSGATSADMIASGQHTGLAAQATRGEVETAVIFVGGNDFIEALKSPDPRASLTGLGRKAAGNVRLAVETLHSSSPRLQILVTTVPSVLDLPEFRDAGTSGRLGREYAQLAAAEMSVFNAELRRLPTSGGRVAVFDFERINRVARLLSPQYVFVAGRLIDRQQPGDRLDRLFLADERHLGVIGQGMFARMIVEALNARFSAGIRSIDDREITAFADSLGSPVAVRSSPIEGGEPSADRR